MATRSRTQDGSVDRAAAAARWLIAVGQICSVSSTFANAGRNTTGTAA